MKILVYGLNFSPELTGIGKYSGEMVAWLSRTHPVRVISAPPYYPSWKVAQGYSGYSYRVEQDGGVLVWRCPLYVPTKLNLVRRLVHLGSFALSSLFVMARQVTWGPDLIICVVPTQFCIPATLLLGRVCGSKTVLHIQDFEIDAMVGLGEYKSGGLMTRLSTLAYKIESFLFKKFDLVSTISHSMRDRTISKGVLPENSVLFPNWSNLEKFRSVGSSKWVRENFAVRDEAAIILYSGNIGDKQGLEIVVAAAKYLQDSLCHFLVLGDGAAKARIEKLAAIEGIRNISFGPLVPADLLPSILLEADCHLVIQRRGAADAVMPSKLANILAIGGNAVITAEEKTELGKLCINYPGIAERVEPEDLDALVGGILRAIGKEKPNKIAINYAERYLDRGAVLNNFQAKLERLVELK